MIRNIDSYSKPRYAPEDPVNAPETDSIDAHLPEPTPTDLSVTPVDRLVAGIATPIFPAMNAPAIFDAKTNVAAILTALSLILVQFGVEWTPDETFVRIASGALTAGVMVYTFFFAKHAKK